MIFNNTRLLALASLLGIMMLVGCGGSHATTSELKDHAVPTGAGATVVKIQTTMEDPDTGDVRIEFGLVTGPKTAQKIYILDCFDSAGKTDVVGLPNFIKSTGYPLDIVPPRLLTQGNEADDNQLTAWAYGQQPRLSCHSTATEVGLRRVIYNSQETKFFAIFKNANSKILYHMGCEQLVNGMGLSLANARNLDFDTMTEDYISEDQYDISCVTGMAIGAEGSFINSCQQAKLNTSSTEYTTYHALFDYYQISATDTDVCQKTQDKIKSGDRRLVLASKGITNLAPLKGLDFQVLDLSNNSIADLSALKSMKNLITLNLSNNQIRNVEVLASLTNLKELTLSGNQIALNDLDVLKSLYLNVFNITGVSFNWNEDAQTFFTDCLARNQPMAMPEEFRKSFDQLLRASGVVFADEVPTSSCHSLYHKYETLVSLDLKAFKTYEVKNGDQGPLKVCYKPSILNALNEFSLMSLKVDLSACDLPDIAKLKDTLHIQELNVETNAFRPGDSCPIYAKSATVSDYCRKFSYTYWCDGTFSQMSWGSKSQASARILGNLIANGNPNLKCGEIYDRLKEKIASMNAQGAVEWDLSNLKLVSLEPLRGLVELTQVNLASNGIPDIEPLKNMLKLSTLQLQGNSITDASPLKTLSNLVYLDLSENMIPNLNGLDQLSGLWMLNLSRNKLFDLRGVESLKKLTYLNVSGNSIQSLQQVQGVDCLYALVSSFNKIDSLTNIFNSAKSCLTYFDFTGNQVNMVTSLSLAANLETLLFENNPVTDVSPIAGLTKMTKVKFDKSRVTSCPKTSANPALNALCTAP